jgi:hypothetical protein
MTRLLPNQLQVGSVLDSRRTFGIDCGLDVLWMVYMSTLNLNEGLGSGSASRHVMNMKDDSDVRILVIVLSRDLTLCQIPLVVYESLPMVPVILFAHPPRLNPCKFPYEYGERLTKETTIRSFFLSPPA